MMRRLRWGVFCSRSNLSASASGSPMYGNRQPNMCSSKTLSFASLLPFLTFTVQAAPFENTTSSTLTVTPTPTSTSNDSWVEPTGGWISPQYTWIFAYPLPILPVKEPKLTYTNPTTGAVIDYYEVEVRSIQKQIYPNLGVADLYAYDGLQPGPTFMMYKGRGKIYSVDACYENLLIPFTEAVVRFTNKSPTNSSVHVHGQYNRAPFDGWAADYALPGQYKDYYYPNAQNARTISQGSHRVRDW